MVVEDSFRSPLFMDDDSKNLGNSPGDDDRGRLHVKVSNKSSEPIPVSITGLVVAAETHLTRLRIRNQAIVRVGNARFVQTLFGSSMDVTIIDGGLVIVTTE